LKISISAIFVRLLLIFALLLARFHDRLMENSCFPFGAISNMCASGNIVGFSPCFLGIRSRASPSPRAQKTGKRKPPILPQVHNYYMVSDTFRSLTQELDFTFYFLNSFRLLLDT
jgi:hypothetical protein